MTMKSIFMVYVIFLLVSFSVMMDTHALRLEKDEKRVSEPSEMKVTTCPKSRIQVTQGAIGTIGGIPEYSVTIVNGCESNCGGIHLSCGEFASTKLVNPSIFRRLAVNDCLVNNGAPMKSGQVISFTYTNTFKYPMVLVDKCYVMPPKRRKRCRKLPPDFLSNLPDNVIDVILMRLPCKEAVRTSILSKKWRYHWCRITKLTLDSHLWETKKDKLYPTVKFTKIIYQILALHEGPITQFSLYISGLKSCPKIDNFIHFLSRNDIKQLVLQLPRGKMYNLPSSLFTCSLLSHLTLANCVIHPPSDFQGFDKLVSLKLCNVNISPELLGSLISQCPLLDWLGLDISEDSLSDVIEINAPKLRSFDYTGNITFICLMNVPLLAEVSLTLYQGSSMEEDNFFFAMFFESCTALERLVLHFDCSEIVPDDDDEVATRLPFDVNCVKYFYLPSLFLEESYELSHVLCCMRSFPCLEYLEIQVGYGDDGILESLELEHFTDLTLNHLREVKVERFEGTPPEMQLVKLLLAKSPGLVRMLIDTWIPDDTIVSRPGAFAEVSKFWRASPKAEVVHKSLFLSL